MFGLVRRLAFFLLLPAAILIPYMSSGDGWKKAKQKVGGWFKPGSGKRSAVDLDEPEPPTVPGAVPVARQTPFRPSRANIENLAEVIRFDISPRWVAQQWHEVSTVSAELEMEGMRVALVTGTRESDLAGALTFYFDAAQRVQRISFQGTTGDPSRLIDLVTRYFHLKQQPALGEALYLARWNSVVTSVCEITRAAKIRSDEPLTRYSVLMEINRPSRQYGLSYEMMSRVKAAADVGRW